MYLRKNKNTKKKCKKDANYVFIRMILNNYVAYISLILCFYQNDFKQLCYVHLFLIT